MDVWRDMITYPLKGVLRLMCMTNMCQHATTSCTICSQLKSFVDSGIPQKNRLFSNHLHSDTAKRASICYIIEPVISFCSSAISFLLIRKTLWPRQIWLSYTHCSWRCLEIVHFADQNIHFCVRLIVHFLSVWHIPVFFFVYVIYGAITCAIKWAVACPMPFACWRSVEHRSHNTQVNR